ncbi:MAG TPA: hypothetical protein VF213_02340 [Dongiaceae bacterium]
MTDFEPTPTSPAGAYHRGPSLIAVGAVFTALFLASLAAPALLAGGAHIPSPFGAEGLARAYFGEHPAVAGLAAFLQFGAAIPLAIYAATVTSRLRFLGSEVAGVSIALGGGLAASFFLALSALFQWVLAQPGVADSAGAVRVLHLLAFAAGGPGHVVPLGLLIAGVAVPAGLGRLLPRWMMTFGLVVAAIAELSSFSLLWPAAAFLLPIARFPAFVWILIAGARLPQARAGAGAAVRKGGAAA